ncbi:MULTISPECIES: aldo/keto reductase [unclassified Lysobacter]|uniref:aldo/keto reductase n=1 Tax=unclassified Lysobacter TaxID=2635362 RepID=UPI001BE89856|nr:MULTISPECIES: aldo/keto reductase [unclassified Lysobacter]MBT2748838.1 aldo/keto reductase [Lysobacter sp. ISL-42]MBT2751115.1 aldo/keto reductase [Lysobacter sp. ISL-50]MBT2779661.1 aldo/keto reductase [Lysobacter sp. ISL-54]MBT2783431.1 aldo/keto reductase [Lysobacter sp. ISL-52]
MQLDHYRTLGRSGLRVSPVCLGTMTFGKDWGWGSDADEARQVFDAYLERGGNYLDTANFYTGGSSETLLGQFARGRRDRLVIASKYSLCTDPGDPNAGGNHRKNLRQSVDASLRRLDTDYLDLLYLHAWDDTTPGDEVMRGFDDLIRAGKVLYAGVSDLPAWQAARLQTLAEARGWSPLVALQIEFSLAQREGERELLPMARELGMGVSAWSPLASGVLTGKYSRADLDPATAQGRRAVAIGNGALTERALVIADTVKAVAAELERRPSQIALAWLLQQPFEIAPVIGARTLAQLQENLGALEVQFDDAQRRRLDEASAIALGFPHDFLALPGIQQAMFGGAQIRRGW